MALTKKGATRVVPRCVKLGGAEAERAVKGYLSLVTPTEQLNNQGEEREFSSLQNIIFRFTYHGVIGVTRASHDANESVTRMTP